MHLCVCVCVLNVYVCNEYNAHVSLRMYLLLHVFCFVCFFKKISLFYNTHIVYCHTKGWQLYGTLVDAFESDEAAARHLASAPRTSASDVMVVFFVPVSSVCLFFPLICS